MKNTLDRKSVVLGAAAAAAITAVAPRAWRWLKRHSNTQVHRINK